jgi:Methyltransferase domain
MQQTKIWNADAARRYDTPGTGMFAPETLGPTVDRLAHLAEGGAVLEFAIGTGRVAVPLVGQGVPVTGIELSPAMVEQLRGKTDGATIPVVMGDMASATAPGTYSLVFLVYNTLSNLLTFDESERAQLFRSPHRYIWPAELDLMAQLAGFGLETRHADWDGAAFTAESRSHVSVYRLPVAP